MSEPPEQIGPYRILDKLGEGGMAVVYLAQQEEPMRRRVALKVLKPGMDSRQVVSRFESERQALAVLDHPNVAKIFDGGMTEFGRPYFAMELVKGVPITDYCDDHRLSTEDRLRLFLHVCAAVQHAHHKGLIHRDLKPSNILVGVVDGEPQPKIIDFGIAKATSTPLTEETLYTRIGQVVGTPQYMSPEQASSSAVDIDTRADIYSLGVVLYELLVGAPPLDLVAIGDHAVRIALMEKDPPRPSTRFTNLGDTRDEIAKVRRTAPDDLRRKLRGDLDWIVMRAIEKDRTRRYETANALGMEIRRFLQHEPILARPPSASYLMRRFIRRNRLAVAAASIAAVGVIGGAAAATLGYMRATEAEQIARREAETAKQVSDFLVEMFRVSDPSESRGNTITARELLDRGADRIRTELTTEPTVRAALMRTMGDAYTSLGLYASAQPLLDESLEVLSAAGRNDEDIARAVFSLAELARFRGEYGRAEELHRRALTLREQLGTGDRRALAMSLEGLGLAFYYQGKYQDAEAMLVRARAGYERSDGADSLLYANVLSAIGSLYHSTDRYEDAEKLFQGSLRISRRHLGSTHPLIASGLNDLALVYEETGRFDEAEQVFRESLSIFDELYEGDHPLLAETMAHLAGVQLAKGDRAEAETTYRNAIAMLERTVGREHMLTARAIGGLGVLLLGSRRYSESENVIAEAVQLNRSLLGDRHVNTGRAMNNMAAALFLQGKYTEAEPFFRESLSIRIENLGEDHADVANSRNNLADLLVRIGRHKEAETLARQATDTYGRIYSESHWRTAVAQNILGASLSGQGRNAEGEPLILESLQQIANSRPGSIYHRMALERTIALYESSGQAESVSQYRRELSCVMDPAECE